MRITDYDKKLTRIKKSRDYYQKKVDAAAKKKMGSREFAKMKREEELNKEEIRENKDKNAIVHKINMEIENTQPGTEKERKLLHRRNRLMKSMGMRPIK